MLQLRQRIAVEAQVKVVGVFSYFELLLCSLISGEKASDNFISGN